MMAQSVQIHVLLASLVHLQALILNCYKRWGRSSVLFEVESLVVMEIVEATVGDELMIKWIMWPG